MKLPLFHNEDRLTVVVEMLVPFEAGFQFAVILSLLRVGVRRVFCCERRT
jgi:hypothetical protein